jgi:hypothetical protein
MKIDPDLTYIKLVKILTIGVFTNWRGYRLNLIRMWDALKEFLPEMFAFMFRLLILVTFPVSIPLVAFCLYQYALRQRAKCAANFPDDGIEHDC